MDEERILHKISELESYIIELNEIIPNSESEYISSIKDRRATERILQISIESVLDLCAIFIKEFKLGPPNDEDDMLKLLSDRIPMIDKIRKMKGFRNLLVHKYGKVDDKIVFKIATQNISDFENFIDLIKKLLNNK